MRKTVVLFVMFGVLAGGVFAMGTRGGAEDSTPAVADAKKGTRIEQYYDYNNKIYHFSFFDKDDKLIKKMEWPRGGHGKAVLSENKRFLVLVNGKYIEHSEEEYLKNGRQGHYLNQIILYDVKGEMKTVKNHYLLTPIFVSNDGKKIVCYLPGVDDGTESFENDKNIIKNPGKTQISVLDDFGNEKYRQEEERFLSATVIAIAPSGEWLGYGYNDYSIINLNTLKKLIVPYRNINRYSVNGINDCGFLILKRHEIGKPVEEAEYDPFQGIYK